MTNKEASDVQEKMVADYLDWKQVTGSGSRPTHPGDVLGAEWMGECKTHTSPNHNVIFKKSVWDKICEEAYSHHKSPAYFVDDGSQKWYKTWVVLTARDLSQSKDQYTIIDLQANVKDSFSFKRYPSCHIELSASNHIIFQFQFNTSYKELSLKRNKLFLTTLETFRDIINLE
jgi:hypothetical protein